VRLAQNDDVPHAEQDYADLHPGDQIEHAVSGSVTGVRLEEPIGQNAILGDAVEHAVGADDSRVHRASQDQKADDDHEGLQGQLDEGRTDNVPGQARDQIAAVEFHAHFVGDDEHGQEADAGGEDNAVNKNDERRLLEVLQFRRLDLTVDLGQGLFAAH